MPIGWGSNRSPRRPGQRPDQRPDQRLYRLIDGCCEPHRQLDVLYASLEEAIADAVAWLEQGGMEGCLEGCRESLLALIGVEVCAANGDWRTCRLPVPLLTPLLCPLELAPALG